MESVASEAALRRRARRALIPAALSFALPALMLLLFVRVARSSLFRILLNADARFSFGAYFGATIGLIAYLLVAGTIMLTLGCVAWRIGRNSGNAMRALGLRRSVPSVVAHVAGLVAFILSFLVIGVGSLLVIIALMISGVSYNIG